MTVGLSQFAPLAQEAAAAVERREVQFPALVAAGKIAADQAALEIRVWRSIAADWRSVVTLETSEVEAVPLDERLAAIDESLRRAERAMNKAFLASSEPVRRQWEAGMPVMTIVDFFGDDARPFLDAWHRYHAIADLLKWARRELPDSDRLPIKHFVEREQQRKAQDRRKAA